MSTVIIDFDGTIAEWGDYPGMGPPTRGAKEALQKIKDKGFTILILSARTSDEMSKYPIDKETQRRIMKEYLDKHEIPYDEVLKSDKPPATFYIDDRGIGFRGDWDKVLEEMENM